jgi:hypothetical protein
MMDPVDGYIDFCHLNPDRTTTDTSDLELWLGERGIPFKHREGPAGDTVFLVPQDVYERAVALWGEYRGSADYILKKHAPWLNDAPKRPQKRL